MAKKNGDACSEMESRLICMHVPKHERYRFDAKKGDGMCVVVNAFRPSKAGEDETLLQSPFSEYGTEEWMLDYFSVEKNGVVVKRGARCQLPLGYESAYLNREGEERKEGPIYKVRAWGVEFLCSYLDSCPEYVKVRDAHARTAHQRAGWDLAAVGWDLPGYFVIASGAHAFTAIGPSTRRYVYDYWCSCEDALVHVEELRKRGQEGKRKEGEGQG
jgi:hypothetical protein